MTDTQESSDAGQDPKVDKDSETVSEKEQKGKGKAPKLWWQNPATVTLLVAIVAAVPALTTGVQGCISANSQLKLEQQKHLYELRQKYLDRLLSENQNQRVLEFLVAVEADPNLKAWADAELEKTKGRIETKQDLYAQTIRVVAALANKKGPIDSKSEQYEQYEQFWELYKEKLLPVESSKVEELMVKIGRELQELSSNQQEPTESLRKLSYTLASTMKEEMRY